VRERPRLELIEGGARPRPARGPALELMALGTGVTLATVLMARLPSWRAELGTFQALFAAAFAFYAIAVWRSTRDAPPIAPSVVMIVAFAARVAMLPVTPSLSDDLYRSLWEGRVVAAGHDPYELNPLAPELESLRDEAVFPRIHDPQRSSTLPPLALVGFAIVAKISPTVWAMKSWILLHDLALVWLLVFWVRGRGLDATAAIAYAWCPLVLTEFAGSGHHDPIAMVWLIASLMYAVRRTHILRCGLVDRRLDPPGVDRGIAFPLEELDLARPDRGHGGDGRRSRRLRLRDPGTEVGSRHRHPPMGQRRAAVPLPRGLDRDPWRALWLAVGLLAVLMVSLAWRRVPVAEATRATLRGALLASTGRQSVVLGWAMLLEPLGRSPGWVVLSLTSILAYGLLAPPIEGSDFHLSVGGRWIEYGIPLAVAATAAILRRRSRRGSGARPSR
jgi:hypothetical protein